jgi:hypothetical protein
MRDVVLFEKTVIVSHLGAFAVPSRLFRTPDARWERINCAYAYTVA